MVFPITPLDAKVELQLSGTWTDVTAYTYTRDPISIRRGRSDEDGRVGPGVCNFSLNNRDGRFSPRNPTSPYYGIIGRNTPVRVSLLSGSVRLLTPSESDTINTPDSVNLSITGDIDLRVDMAPTSWSAGGVSTSYLSLISKSLTAGQRSYRLATSTVAGTPSTAGHLRILWSSDGTNEQALDSAIPLPVQSGRLAVRATLDVDNGAGGKTATFYYASTIAGPWTQLGDPVISAGVTSIFNSTSPVAIGAAGASVYAAEIYQGIAGVVRANPVFTSQTEGATSFVDGAANTWTVAGAALTARRYRFYGEVPSWPQRWDLSQRDVWVPIEASGVTRRLGQGASPLDGAVQRGVLKAGAPTAYAYWPLEDASGSTSIASGLTGGPAMTIAGTPDLASDDTFASSRALPVLAGASFSGAVNAYTSTNIINLQSLLGVPAAGDVTGGVIARLWTTGTAARWDLTYTTAASGSLTLSAFDSFGTSILSTTTHNTLNGQPLIVTLQLVQSGGDVAWSVILNGYLPSNTLGGPVNGTLVGRTVGAAGTVQINPNQLLTSTVVGHLAVNAAVPDNFLVFNYMRGHVGEFAGRRVARLCAEEGIAFASYGEMGAVAMGVQLPGTLLDLLAECETSDMGQVFETREALGLAYRSRAARENQAVALALAYGNLTDLAPIEDDQGTRNDVTVSRIGGSSARTTIDSGPLSTLAPPNGVGRYNEELSLSLAADSQCADQASWRANAGTIDEPRYPTIRAQLETPAFVASAALTASALAVEHGDLITVTGTPTWLPPGTVRQHTIGQVEVLAPFAYSIDFVCQPATPTGSTGMYDDTNARYSADGATLSVGITSTATGAAALSIVTPTGKPLWTSAPADFPLDIVMGGEQIRLSAIAATASPQAATVSARSVNGVIKAHLAGAALDVADPDYYAL